MNCLVLGSSNSSMLVCHLQSKDFCNWEVHIKRWPEVKHGSTESTFFVQFLFLLELNRHMKTVRTGSKSLMRPN